MSQYKSDRLDRIEATLERVSQQLDNQVIACVELRKSATELRQTTALLIDPINALTISVTKLSENVTALTTKKTF